MKSPRIIFCVALFAWLVGTATSHAAPSSLRPNILVIVSDDQGYADAGFQGSKEVPTPHLDQLAASGVRFTSGYASHPFCSPTRAGLLTGRYQQRFGHEGNPFYNPADHRQGLPLSETLLPAHLLQAGYATGWIGKWHLGAAPEFAPGKRGFQETYGFTGGKHYFIDWKPDPRVEYAAPIERGLQKTFGFTGDKHYFRDWKLNFAVDYSRPVDPPEHLTVALGQEAAAFVRRHDSEPWFLYLALSAPHTPYDPTLERRARFSAIADMKRRCYVAQVSLMDDAIGETLQALRDTGQHERTLVIFFSDNGGAIGRSGSADNAPLRGGKGSLYEGGVRVPFLMSWPMQLAPGKTDARPVSSIDVFATALGAAGVPMPTDKKYDSVNLMPFLTGKKTGDPHEQMFWRSNKLRAVREGNWKLVRKGTNPPMLYDLGRDIGETTDVAAVQPAVTARLAAALAAWDKEMIAPAFKGYSANGENKAMKN